MATATHSETRTVRDMLEMLQSIPEDQMDKPFLIEMPSGQYDLTKDCDIDWSDSDHAVLDCTSAPHHTSH